jgi:glutathione S-transferase
LTGGYRKTPVLQIGADVYCDSNGIARELERRFPNPTLFPVAGPGH